MIRRLSFLGPEGTFTEQAAFAYGPSSELLPYPSIEEAAAAVDRGEADEAIVPMENSLHGSVTNTLDLLIHDTSLYIRSELVLPISHCLIATERMDISRIQIVYSHPQALAQCQRFLKEQMADAEFVASLSTASGVQDLAFSSVPAAAIATERAARLNGHAILVEGIEDNPNNVTRFVVLAPTDHPITGSDKTSLCWSHDENVPGLLFGVLEELAVRNINLAKIESRPTRDSLGKYYFLMDLEGHREDPIIKEALDSIQRRTSMIRIFGSYPRYNSQCL